MCQKPPLIDFTWTLSSHAKCCKTVHVQRCITYVSLRHICHVANPKHRVLRCQTQCNLESSPGALHEFCSQGWHSMSLLSLAQWRYRYTGAMQRFHEQFAFMVQIMNPVLAWTSRTSFRKAINYKLCSLIQNLYPAFRDLIINYGLVDTNNCA